MKGTYSVLRVVAICAGAVLMVSAVRAQNPFEDAVKQLTSDNVKGYVQPFVDGFGANLNSGLYNTAAISDVGLHVEFRFVGIGTLIGDAEKTYMAVPPPPFDQTPVQTATIFGDQGAVVLLDPNDPNGIRYRFQNGQVKTSLIPLVVPQLEVGNVFGTQATLRYVPIPEISDFPKVTLFGIGARHNISQYIPMSPVDVAAGFFYQTLEIGGIFDAKTFNFGAQASKSFAVLTVYGGLQYETSSMTLSYTYTGPPIPGVPPNPSITLDLEGGNKFRFLAGLGLNLAILHLNADINFGKVTVVSGGIGFGI